MLSRHSHDTRRWSATNSPPRASRTYSLCGVSAASGRIVSRSTRSRSISELPQRHGADQMGRLGTGPPDIQSAPRRGGLRPPRLPPRSRPRPLLPLLPPHHDAVPSDLRRFFLLVTLALHMRRARVLCARAGFQVLPFPVDFHVSVGRAFTILDLLPTASSLSQTEIALRELYGFLFSQLVGR